MTNKNYTMEELINDSMRVKNGMVAIFPQFDGSCGLNVSESISKFPGHYSMNNSTIAFVYKGEFYVTPYTLIAYQTLTKNGFESAKFYVPFSNGDYPLHEQDEWYRLLEKAEDERKKSFINDCEEFCDEHGIYEISKTTLQNCFEMPNDGVLVKRLYYEQVYYPVISEYCLDCEAIKNIGKYCYNNGRVVFVYRDGKTYVAKGYSIISELKDAGYTQAGLFVPFSNGEEIFDPYLSQKWMSIAKG